jgi:phosphohistidine phosphatase
MNLLLWRHAAAEDGVDDLKRNLTKRGERQAAQVAAWLQARLPADVQVLVSPANRARQTAEALTADYKVVPALAPGASAADLIAACDWPNDRGTVVIVGHQPTLGRLAALLLSGTEQSWAIKKGAVWWISNRDREEGAANILRAVLSPDLS